MSGFTRKEWIARTPKEVFEFITASENAPKVVSSVKSMVKLTDGAVRVGTKYLETRLMNGKEHQTELEVIEYVPNRIYAMRNFTEGIEIIYRYVFSPENGGTQIDLVCTLKASGLNKLMLPVVSSIFQKEDGDHLQRLKKAIE